MGYGLSNLAGVNSNPVTAAYQAENKPVTVWKFEKDFRPVSVSNVIQHYGGRKMNDVNFVFEDNYKFGKRLTVEAHGTLTDRGYAVIYETDDRCYTGPEYASHLINVINVNFSDYDSVRLMVCFSGNGGERSFAAGFASTINQPTKSFIGEVATSGEVEEYVNLTARENTLSGKAVTTEALNQTVKTLQNRGDLSYAVIKDSPLRPYQPAYFDKYGFEATSVLSPY